MLLLRLPAVFPSPAAAAFLGEEALERLLLRDGSSADEGASGAESGAAVSISIGIACHWHGVLIFCSP